MYMKMKMKKMLIADTVFAVVQFDILLLLLLSSCASVWQ